MTSKPKGTSGKPEDKELAERWLERITKRENDCKSWWEDAARVTKRYRNEGEAVKQGEAPRGRRFNVIWSNISVLKPALYAKDPKPEVERKHKDKDAVGRLASQILERACLVSIQDQSFGDSMKMARDDRLLSSRGLVWLRYLPTYGEEQPQRIPLTPTDNGSYAGAPDGRFRSKGDGEVLEDDLGPFMAGDTYKPVVSEKVGIEFVHHKDFVHADAPSWDKVTWAARRVWMTKRQIADRFGASLAAHIDTKRSEAKAKDDKTPRDTAPIWEICDKDNGEWLWVCPDYKDGPLDVKPDPLKLSSFFPCPRPVYGTLTPDSLIPIPDYTEYADQARELDLLTDRAYRLIEGIRVAGVYDANAPGLSALFNNNESKFHAVNNWAVFAEKGGLKSAMDMMDISGIAQALEIVLKVREQIKRDLYEISGISDIMRGDTNPNETLGAQKLKGSFGTSRVKEPQSEFQRFVRDTLQIVAEIICEHFSPEQIAEMADVADLLPEQFKADPQAAMQMFQEAIALLKDDRARGYKISIETDSTIELDEQQEKQDRIEFLTAATGFMEKGAMIVQQSPAMAPLVGEMLQWGMKAFRTSRDLEKAFEAAIEGVAQEQQQKQQNPPPNPEMEKLKMEAQAKSQELQAKTQFEQQKLQIEGQKGQMELAFKERELQLKERELEMKAQQAVEQIAMQREQSQNEMLMRQQESEQTMGLKREEMAMKSNADVERNNSEDENASEGGESSGMMAVGRGLEAISESQKALAEALMRSKTIKRGPDGRAMGIE